MRGNSRFSYRFIVNTVLTIQYCSKNVIFRHDFHDFVDENFCWNEKPRSWVSYITIDKCSSDSNTYCLHFLRYYFLSNNVEERPVFEILQKIEILQYPDADAEEKFLLNLEGRKGAGGPSDSRAHQVVNFKIIYIYNH